MGAIFSGIGAFFGGKLGRVLLIIGALAALIGAAHLFMAKAKEWHDEVYLSGLEAGRTEVRKQWQEANNTAILARIDRIASDAKRSDDAVMAYLGSVSKETEQLSETRERIEAYAASTAGTVQCLDADGVRIIEQSRAALGYPAAPGTATGNPASVP